MGNGVGLSICKMICESLDGDIKVVSFPNTGSFFTFTMKVKEVSELLSRSDPEDSKSSSEDECKLINAIQTHSSFNSSVEISSSEK